MKTYVPVSVNQLQTPQDRTYYLQALKSVGAEGIALTLIEFGDTQKTTEALRESRICFEQAGFETALWFGGSLLHFQYSDETYFCKRIDIHGNALPNHFCPLDERFTDYYCEQVRSCLQAGFRLAFFDDDFRLNFWTGSAQCFCENHMKQYRKHLGADCSASSFENRILFGAPNVYRTVWQEVTKESLLSFANKLRKTADSVDESIRLGLATSGEVWAIPDCAEALVSALAGKNRPWIRLMGAPYWNNNSDLANTLELVRALYDNASAFSDDIYAEGDSFPHYRAFCSAASMELFDTLLRAACPNLNILKYVHPYQDTAGNETAYLNAASRNLPMYTQIEALFSGKHPTGYRLIEQCDNALAATFKENLEDAPQELLRYPSIQLATANTLPTCYAGDTPRIAIGTNAISLSDNDLKCGTVLDYDAAKILTQSGIDVGLTVCTPEYLPVSPSAEKYEIDLITNQHILLRDGLVRLPNVSLNENVKPVTEFSVNGKRYISSYCFENENCQKFYVLLFSVDDNRHSRFVMQNYIRQQNLIAAYRYLSGKPIAASLTRHPGVYLLTAESTDGMTVGLWNCSTDAIRDEVLCLNQAYSSVHFLNCSGTLCDNRVKVDYIPAFEFGFFEVK